MVPNIAAANAPPSNRIALRRERSAARMRAMLSMSASIDDLRAISCQLSAISHQLSVISFQPFAFNSDNRKAAHACGQSWSEEIFRRTTIVGQQLSHQRSAISLQRSADQAAVGHWLKAESR
jgi:hypothetical protein